MRESEYYKFVDEGKGLIQDFISARISFLEKLISSPFGFRIRSAQDPFEVFYGRFHSYYLTKFIESSRSEIRRLKLCLSK